MKQSLIEQICSMYNSYKFAKFLNQLSDGNNNLLIESIFEGYGAIFEYPHLLLTDDTAVDLYVEQPMPEKNDPIDIKRKQLTKSAGYVNKLISALEYDATIIVPQTFLRNKNEKNIIEQPRETIEYPNVSDILAYLYKTKNLIAEQLAELDGKRNSL